MEQRINKERKVFVIIISLIFVVFLIGMTYAFFNYTRTGTSNVIKTGRIYFNADQGNNTVTLSDLFPISVGENETVTASTPGVGSLKLHIEGDTTYTEGVEYLIEAVEVAGNGNTSLPISIDISYAATSVEQGQDPNVIGTADKDYFTNRGGNTSRYKLLSTGSISEGEDILVGYIAPGNTGIDGELTILAYLDADNIAITDTYDEDEPETDTNGTTTNWVDGRTVFTTEEWNALQATGVSFKIKATANEGTWVEPIPTKSSCLSITVISEEDKTAMISPYSASTIYDVNCGGSDIVIPSSIDGYTIIEIGSAAFVGAVRSDEQKLTSVILPNTIVKIGANAFQENKIKKMVIPDSVEEIGASAFNGMNDGYMEELILGKGVKMIGSTAFGSNKIEEVILPSGIKSIGSAAFWNNKISNVIIPFSVESMKCNAFVTQNGLPGPNIIYENELFECEN